MHIGICALALFNLRRPPGRPFEMFLIVFQRCIHHVRFLGSSRRRAFPRGRDRQLEVGLLVNAGYVTRGRLTD